MKHVIIIGGGPGGYVAAIRAAQLGAKVTLIEKDNIGGTCLNVGCIPTKCLLHTTSLAEEIRKRGAELGLTASGLSIDFEQVMAHKNKVSQMLRMGIMDLMALNKIDVISGTGSLSPGKKVKVVLNDGAEQELTADAIILATGSKNSVPPIPGILDNPNCIDSTGALNLEKIPESMVVIGGGVVGLEMTCAYAAFGTKVTVIEALPAMLPMLDADLTKIGVKHLKKMGVKFYLECTVESIEEDVAGAGVICRTSKGEKIRLTAEKVLIATGRKANTASLNLESCQINNNKGSIIVDEKMETSCPGIYAIGDCVYGKVQLAHTASSMGEVAAENICGQEAIYDESTNPSCVYIEPEAASVGLTEEQCLTQKISYKVGKFPLSGNGKAIILNNGEGLVKIIAHEKTNLILGMHIVGPRASDLIAEGALAIRMKATLEDVIQTIHSHPTITEAIREAALSAERRAIHYAN